MTISKANQHIKLLKINSKICTEKKARKSQLFFKKGQFFDIKASWSGLFFKKASFFLALDSKMF